MGGSADLEVLQTRVPRQPLVWEAVPEGLRPVRSNALKLAANEEAGACR